MAENKGIAGDENLHLRGIRAYIDPERGLLFVENEKRGEWLLSCPHCDAVYRYKLGETLHWLPPDCHRALVPPPTVCETCKKDISFERPWSDHDHDAHQQAVQRA